MVHCANQEEQWSTRAKIIGSSGNDKLKIKAAATKQQTWHVFSGRFEVKITADDERDLLKDNYITAVDCKELKKTQKWQECFAAFHIIVDTKTKTLSSNKTFCQSVSRFTIGCLSRYNRTL